MASRHVMPAHQVSVGEDVTSKLQEKKLPMQQERKGKVI